MKTPTYKTNEKNIQILFLKFAYQSKKILFTRRELINLISKEYNEETMINDLISNNLKLIYKKFYPCEDVFSLVNDEEIEKIIKEAIDIEIDLKKASDLALRLFKNKYSKCLESGQELAFFIEKQFERMKIQASIEKIEEHKDYTYIITLKYPSNITIIKRITYCNKCLNSEKRENFIEKCTLYELP